MRRPTVEEVRPETEVLETARRLINGDRQAAYGDAVEDFKVVAEFWTTYLRAKGLLADGKRLVDKDVALLMGLLKIRREATHPKFDNVVDACGYLALAERCEARRRLEEKRLRELIEKAAESHLDAQGAGESKSIEPIGALLGTPIVEPGSPDPGFMRPKK